MTIWKILYDSVRDDAFYLNGTVTATTDSGALTDGEARAAVVEHHRASGVDASHVWVMQVTEVAL